MPGGWAGRAVPGGQGEREGARPAKPHISWLR
jgi:hypothetical protein